MLYRMIINILKCHKLYSAKYDTVIMFLHYYFKMHTTVINDHVNQLKIYIRNFKI